MRRWTGLLVLALALGCGPAETGKPPTSPPTPSAVPGTPASRAAEYIAWKKRAADLLPKVVDNASADAHSAELIALVRDCEDIMERSKVDKPWEWSKEQKDALEKEFGEENKASSKAYEEAAQPFQVYGKRKDIVPYLTERYGIDIRRMKTVEKK